MLQQERTSLTGYALIGWMMTGIVLAAYVFGIDRQGPLIVGGLLGAVIGGFSELGSSLVAKLLWVPMAVIVAGLETLGYLVQ